MHGPRASCARSPPIQTERDRYQESCKSALHKAKARDALKSKLLLLQRRRPWLCADGVTRSLIPVSFKLTTTVVARRDARVRGQQHGCAVRGQHPMREKESFFGDFLPISKKLPAACGGSFCSRSNALRKRSSARMCFPLTPTLSPASGGEGVEAGFALPRERQRWLITAFAPLQCVRSTRSGRPPSHRCTASRRYRTPSRCELPRRSP